MVKLFEEKEGVQSIGRAAFAAIITVALCLTLAAAYSEIIMKIAAPDTSSMAWKLILLGLSGKVGGKAFEKP